jgi:flagellar basal body rod protein FlgG
MIDSATARALAEIAERARDLLRSGTPGFEPERDDVRGPSRIVPDSDSLSVAAPPGAWFVTAESDGRRSYTRDGSFALRDGKLVTRGGGPVYGFSGESSASAPLAIDPVDASLGRARDARIEPGGTLAYTRTAIDPRTGAARPERVVAGTLALARFPAGSASVRRDADLLRAPAGTEPHLGRPGDGNFGGVATNSRDRGRFDFDLGLVRLQEAYTALAAARAVTSARGTFTRTAFDLVK